MRSWNEVVQLTKDDPGARAVCLMLDELYDMLEERLFNPKPKPKLKVKEGDRVKYIGSKDQKTKTGLVVDTRRYTDNLPLVRVYWYDSNTVRTINPKFLKEYDA